MVVSLSSLNGRGGVFLWRRVRRLRRRTERRDRGSFSGKHPFGRNEQDKRGDYKGHRFPKATVQRRGLQHDTEVCAILHVNGRNCNNFSNDLCKALLGTEIPGYVNRCAYIASFFSCCIPSTRDEDDEPLPASRFQGKGNRLGSSDQHGVDVRGVRVG